MLNYFTFLGLKLYFWSNEGNEPIHVHVAHGKPSLSSTKFWILSDGSCQQANNKGELSRKEIKLVTKFIVKNYDEICETWKDFYNLKEITFYK